MGDPERARGRAATTERVEGNSGDMNPFHEGVLFGSHNWFVSPDFHNTELLI